MSIKRSLITLGRICKTGFKNFGRNAWLSVAATAIMYVALVVMLAGVALNLIMRDTIVEYEKQFTVAVYIKDSAPKERIDELETTLEGQDFIREVSFISKDEALKRFQERYASNPEILEGFNVAGGNSLPASFDVVLSNLERSEEVESVVLGQGFDKDVVSTVSVGKTSKNSNDAKRTVQVVANAKRLIARASVGASLLFAGISMLIIFNTIRMAIFTRSEEIKIMKLIGATPGYIRGPFLFEAALYGVVAGTFSYATVTAVLVALGKSTTFLSQIAVSNTIDLYKSNWILVYFATIAIGALIGLLSSLLAISKHLKLKRW